MTTHDAMRPWETPSTPLIVTAINAEARRITTLQVLGGLAVATGLLIALTAPSFGDSLQFFVLLPGWPWLSGTLLVLFGSILLTGVFTPHPRIALLGSVLCFIWYLTFGVEYMYQWLDWLMWKQYVKTEPPIYPAADYFGLAALHILNARGIREHRGIVT